MAGRSRHPGIETLTELAQGRLAPDAAADARAHVAGCRRCREELSLVETLLRAGRVHEWHDPPESLTEAVRRRPQEPIPPVIGDSTPEVVAWTPADVRGTDVAATGLGRTLSRAVEGAEIAVAVFPTSERGLERIHGRVWLTSPDHRPIDVLVVVDDHVLDRAGVANGESFVFEVIPAPWRIELHLPGGTVAVIERPDA